MNRNSDIRRFKKLVSRLIAIGLSLLVILGLIMTWVYNSVNRHYGALESTLFSICVVLAIIAPLVLIVQRKRIGSWVMDRVDRFHSKRETPLVEQRNDS